MSIKQGRKLSLGRFDTREELEDWIWHLWLNTKANQTDIAKQCKVSQATVANVLNAGVPE